MAARDDQDLTLVIAQSTDNRARVDQDITLAITQPTSSYARVDQDVLLVIVKRVRNKKVQLFAVT